MTGSPPVPSYMVPWTRFTPTFQSSNGDASIGDGLQSASYRIVGQTMVIQWLVQWGTTTTPGTGNLLVPLPRGWTPKNVRPDGMPAVSIVPLMLGNGVKSSAGTVTTDPVFVTSDGSTFVQAFVSVAGALAGDIFLWQFVLPLVDNLPQ